MNERTRIEERRDGDCRCFPSHAHHYAAATARVNHFRNHYELTRKDLIVKNMNRAMRTIEREQGKAAAAAFAFMPRTFNLPAEYDMNEKRE